ncbi:MAG: FtsX-like permease family protein [Aestuariivirga sp.]
MNRFLPFEWILAVRFLREGAAQTLMIIVGTSVGVGVIVFMSALLTGLSGNFLNRVMNTQSHIVVSRPDATTRPLLGGKAVIELATIQNPSQRALPVDQWQKILSELRGISDVVIASPTVSGAAQLLRGATTKSLSLTGIEPDSYYRIVNIPSFITAGTADLTTQNVLIGVDLASDLGVAVGDKLRITSTSSQALILSIGGIFDLGNRGANRRTIFVALRTGQSLLGLIGGATGIEVTVTDPYAAETIAQTVASVTGMTADSWIKSNAQFFTAVNAQTLSSAVIRFFIGLSVAFGIASVLIVSVVQRSKEIGILRAMGSSQGQILRIFVIQGGLVGLSGSIGGSILGLSFVFFWQQLARNADGTVLFPLVISINLILATAILATLTGLAAAILPAMRAAKLDPVVAIRG